MPSVRFNVSDVRHRTAPYKSDKRVRRHCRSSYVPGGAHLEVLAGGTMHHAGTVCGGARPEVLAGGTMHHAESEIQPRSCRSRRRPHFPKFDGEGERWSIWHQRFEVVTNRLGWSRDDKLLEMLAKMRGEAAEFVFEQLSRNTRARYKSLVYELDMRYRVVERPRTYQAMFSRRCQEPGESVEEFAVALKYLYSQAYVNRDRDARREDLVRRFLDGLEDEEARHMVEFAKDPQDIDTAVEEVVRFFDIYHGSDLTSRKRIQPKECSDSDISVERSIGTKVAYVDVVKTEREVEVVALFRDVAQLIGPWREARDRDRERTDWVRANGYPNAKGRVPEAREQPVVM